MRLLDTLAPHLPFLRRYARALVGDQPSGDHLVRRTLQALVSGEVTLDAATAPRIALYQLFHAAGAAVFHETSPGSSVESDVATARLARLAPTHRQAFLLTALEGFNVAEAALILGMPFEAVSDLILAAQREIEAELATQVLIIEDQPVIAADIEAIVRELGHQVIGVATTRDEAIGEAGRTRPGLILADIQLADGSSGIDAVGDILEGAAIPVIFITAFPERLLTGERPEPTFLITKPFDATTVKATIGQALFFHPDRAR